MRARHDQGRSRAGFTLLEVLVALVIFALSFGVLAQIIQTGLRQSTVAESTAVATSIARSQLARVGTELPLQVGQTEGETEDGMRWHTNIQLAEPPNEDLGIASYQVQVMVSWGPGAAERVTLTTLRIGPVRE
jgi:general secretion pathway protein I